MTKKQDQAIKDLPQTGFQFSEEAHLYILDGKPLTGVTTILSVIAKPALISWAANQVAEWIRANCGADDNGVWFVSEADLETARKAHAQRKKDAGNIGTKAHDWIERYIKAMIAGKPFPPIEIDIAPITDNFLKWVEDNQITFLESGKRLYSREHWYAGTCDLVYLKDGKKYIGDVKTSSGIYGREYYFQMAGYQIALEENGEKDIFGSTIIRCGKYGSFEVKDSFDLESDKAGFLAA